MTPGRLPREEREDARVGARGGGLLRHAAALAWKLLSPAARAAAFAVEETIPRPVARVFAASLCCPGDQGAGRHPAGGARGEKRRSLAGGRVGARPRNGIRGTWWRRLDPGEVSASDPPAPSCLLNAALPPPDPAPRSPLPTQRSFSLRFEVWVGEVDGTWRELASGKPRQRKR